jgi:hypothetical protein
MPNHPEHLDDPEPKSKRGPAIIAIAVVVLLAVVVGMHLSGIVGPGAR